METIREYMHTERYEFDFGECSTVNGYAQVDTGQDAWYFGIWANPFALTVITYCEGDLITEKAATEDEFINTLTRIKTFSDASGYGFKGIDPGFNKALETEFIKLGVGCLLH